MRPDDAGRLQHMIDAAEDMLRFVAGRSRGDLDSDRLLLYALVRALEVFGEAAGQLSAELRRSAPEIPRITIISMRNRLIHGYADVDAKIVWRTVTEDVPPLLDALRALRAQGGEAS
ncbi:MAG: DUF86 domain-containing protein [Acidobacteria bacterium]|nr:DUF86 domain-containing protein [Acidobacteriota bacterium]